MAEWIMGELQREERAELVVPLETRSMLTKRAEWQRKTHPNKDLLGKYTLILGVLGEWHYAKTWGFDLPDQVEGPQPQTDAPDGADVKTSRFYDEGEPELKEWPQRGTGEEDRHHGPFPRFYCLVAMDLKGWRVRIAGYATPLQVAWAKLKQYKKGDPKKLYLVENKLYKSRAQVLEVLEEQRRRQLRLDTVQNYLRQMQAGR